MKLFSFLLLNRRFGGKVDFSRDMFPDVGAAVVGFLRQFLHKSNDETEKRKESVVLSPLWGWAWALDEEEDPPPSSIVSRRDTGKLAEVADQAVLGENHTISGNNLWSFVINFLTATPGKNDHILHKSVNGATRGRNDG